MSNITFKPKIFFLCTLIGTLLFGCGRTPSDSEIDAKVRAVVAKKLKKDVSEIEITKPLSEQGANELDVVEIVMALDDTFKISLPDEAVKLERRFMNTNLTVQQFSVLVSKQLKSK